MRTGKRFVNTTLDFEVNIMMYQVCLVMELAKGGELFDKLLEQGCLQEQEAGRLMTQVSHSPVTWAS